jgi:hypothetical protein
MRFHREVLSVSQEKALHQLGLVMTRHGFYLGGGTAVALHLGHRRSVDLDWFAQELIDPLQLAQEIRRAGIRLSTSRIERGTLHGYVLRVRVSFLEYLYPLLRSARNWKDHRCEVASLDDLACMKLAAIAQRGSKKDFVDIYALGLKHKPLVDMIALYQEKYSVRDTAHLFYSLTYFDDANTERIPTMLWDSDWREVKATILRWVGEMST